MLFAIRINLIGTGKRRRRAGGGLPDIPNIGVLLFVLVMVIEAAVLYSWHAGASEAANQVDHRMRKVKHDVEVAKKIHSNVTMVKKELIKLSSQVRLFDVLKSEKHGPVDALHFLSFMLQPREPAEWPREEQKLMEAAGWRVQWDARRAWFNEVKQVRWKLLMKGKALAHEDVAEVQRRLESSPYFRNVALKYQVKETDTELEDDYVSFTIEAALVYLVDKWVWPPVEEPDPEELEAAKKAAGGDALPVLPSSIKAPRDSPSLDAPEQATEGAAAAPEQPTARGEGAAAIASPSAVTNGGAAP
jgi:hypothetical protein